MTSICLGITAKNEERALPGCLRSLLRAVDYAEARLPLRFQVVVIADDCTDRTAEVARAFARVQVLHSTGGKVEAQRRVANTTPFVVFSDADLLIGETALDELCRAMLENPSLQVAYATKQTLPPVRQSLLAKALYCYNRVNGFQVKRKYFNGRFFAIRDWRAPTLAELAPRLRSLPHDRFYQYHAGLRIDDIWLSRDVLRRHGADAIREVESAQIWYRPPETFRGMYRMYLRMRLEIERLNRLFPETVPVHQHRGYDQAALAAAPARDLWLWRLFRLALLACRIGYRLERFYYQHLSTRACVSWKPVEETKESLDTAHPA